MAVEHSDDAHPSIRNLSVRIVRRLSNSFALYAKFDATPGFTMLLGLLGGGKTTLLNCMAGLERPSPGRIILNAARLFESTSNTPGPPWRRALRYLCAH